MPDGSIPYRSKIHLSAGKHIREARALAGLSVNGLAVAATVPVVAILRLEAADHFEPETFMLLALIAAALKAAGVQVTYPENAAGTA